MATNCNIPKEIKYFFSHLCYKSSTGDHFPWFPSACYVVRMLPSNKISGNILWRMGKNSILIKKKPTMPG